MKLLAPLLALALLGTAPFQCASDPDPEQRLEDTPAEALWNLSERFRSNGQADARMETLRQIVEQYPSSREASRARLVLEGREVAPNPPPAPDAGAGAGTGT